jgi:hypothetical protein
LEDGQAALVRNAWGSLELQVLICADLPRGVALAHKGRWLGVDSAGANINVLNGGLKSDMGESSAVHSVEVKVHRASDVHILE